MYGGFNLIDTIMLPWLDAYDDGNNITLYVCYNKYSCLDNGDILHSKDTKVTPFVTITGGDLTGNDNYTYMLLDVDEYTPEKPIAKTSLHWLVRDIQGSIKSYEHIADNGRVVVPYTRAHKPYYFANSDIGIHHYYNLVFRQGEAEQAVDDITLFERFDVREFATKYKLGYPVTGLVHKVNYTKDN
ncbi:hypothetical protein GOP47_0021882 [Adiantum capillus-veneris]|uniref:Uncharacterized protein n=1 Tax=Adiantum capillus-veneris TaxID=13818 RepID=A0A9D4U8J4_ADICA|nr:hypothetical protein GOP47_0021882 [Adiantum capillus-veneris]